MLQKPNSFLGAALPLVPKVSALVAKLRRKSVDRRLRIMDKLATGLLDAKIARAENPMVRRLRQISADALERRKFDPADGCAQFKMQRRNKAMMMEGDLYTLDRFIKSTSELDRRHGFFPDRPPQSALAMRRIAPSGSRSLAKRGPRAGADTETFLSAKD